MAFFSQTLWLVGVLAMCVTISSNEHLLVAADGTGGVAQSLQAKLNAMDHQLWGTDALGKVHDDPEKPEGLHLIEDEALKKAGFTMLEADGSDKGAVEALPESETQTNIEASMEVQLAAQQKMLKEMKVHVEEANTEAKHEKAVRKVIQAGVGTRMREQQRFYSYMSRWWRLHRKWMKRHNQRLYSKLREHRALSLASLWKPFLLRWHYVQPRIAKGYRYNWNDDGTYETKRFLMKSKRKRGNTVVATRIRSVNNICFPGLLSPERRSEYCTYRKRVSARAVQFLLEHDKFQVPSLTVMRAYTTFRPDRGLGGTQQQGSETWMKAKPAITFVSVQGLHWQLMEVIEYCDVPSSAAGVAVPVAFSSKTSTPTREYSLKFMEWGPIKMGRELLDTGATVESMELKTKDEKLRISCIVPVEHPQSIDGEQVSLTQQKCSLYIRQWDFNLKCPAGKIGSIALKTKVTARDDSGAGDGKPTMTPAFKSQLAYDKNKISMQFEQQAVLHVHSKNANSDVRNSVPVVMTQSSHLQWTPDPRFKSSKHLYFSFIVSDVSKLKTGILNWDPEFTGSYNHGVQTMEQVAPTPPPLSSANKVQDSASNGGTFMQVEAFSSNSAKASHNTGWLAACAALVCAVGAVFMQQDLIAM